MEVLHNCEKKTNLSLALGFFDGIHKGHKKVIENAVNFAKNNGLKSAVVSFSDHPSCLLLNRKPEYILPLQDKIEIIQKLGVDYLYIINFDLKFSQMTKENYTDFLINMTSPKAITTGFNHFFGKDKQGNTEFLYEYCNKNNIKYTKIQPVKIKDTVISSSAIRKSIISADLKTVSSMLDYDFYIKGTVIKGSQLGEKLGFKTINIKYPENIIKLPYGVYSTYCETDGQLHKSVTNWGIKPTVKANNSPIVETHILNYDADLYGKQAKVIFLTKIRDEMKFDTLDELKAQIKKDAEFSIYNIK